MASAQAEVTLVGPGARTDETAVAVPRQSRRRRLETGLVRPAGRPVSAVLGLVPAGRGVPAQFHQRPRALADRVHRARQLPAHVARPAGDSGVSGHRPVRRADDPADVRGADHRRHPADGDAAPRHSLDDAALVHPPQRARQHARLSLHVQHPVRHLSVGGDRHPPLAAAAISQQCRAGQFLDRLSRAALLRPRVDLHRDAARDPALVLRGRRDRRRRVSGGRSGRSRSRGCVPSSRCCSSSRSSAARKPSSCNRS